MIGEPNEEAIPEAQIQEQDGAEHQRVIAPLTNELLRKMIAEQEKTNLYLAMILGEQL